MCQCYQPCVGEGHVKQFLKIWRHVLGRGAGVTSGDHLGGKNQNTVFLSQQVSPSMLLRLKGRYKETNLYSLENPQASILTMGAKASEKEESMRR